MYLSHPKYNAMLSSALIKQFKSYQQKKFRHEDGVFVAETPKVAEVLLQSKVKVEKVLALESWWNDEKNRQLLLAKERKDGNLPEKIEISAKELERISGLSCPQQVWMLCRKPDTSLPAVQTLKSGISLLLDDLQDPGNLGTILRIADWFGINRVLCTENCADAFQPKTVQSSMGSVGIVPVYEASHADFMEIMKSNPAPLEIFGTFMRGDNLFECRLNTENAWYIIGNEAHGISSGFERLTGGRLTIPSSPAHTATGAESLNAAVATAILCAEISRRKSTR